MSTADFQRQQPRVDMAGPCLDRDTWLTPPELLSALGEFDLDPCAAVGQPWPTAKRQLTILDNGLNHEWSGRVWLNPPYGNQTELFMKRLAAHGNGIALIYARTETGIFFPWVWEHASAVLFLKGRLRFRTIDGKVGAPSTGPSVLVAYGARNGAVLDAAVRGGVAGHLAWLRGP